MQHMQIATAIYENGVLRLPGPLPNLADGDRVEIAVVRVVPIDRDAPEEVARRERILKAFDEHIKALANSEPEGDYEQECKEFDEHRGGSRKLFPPEMRGITW
jgi:predicted DNA-binding antitoxin AbrB/MazE fold protein